MIMTRICKCCGKEFTTSKQAQKFCSVRCRESFYYYGQKQTEFKCAFCGKEFTSLQKKKYCSSICRISAYRMNQKRKQQPKKPKHFMSIEEINEAARALNMTYGQYMAKYGYAKEGASGGI